MGRKHRNAAKRKTPILVEELVPPTEQQLARGSYNGDFVVDEAGRQAWAYRSTEHDPVARWERAKRIDQRQKAVIDHMRRLWDMVGIKQRVTASYGERVGGGGSAEIASLAMIEAKEDLDRIESYFVGLRPYWRVFENCCRFGMSAGVAGEEFGFGSRSSQDRAHQIVLFIADFIATRERI